MKLIQDYHRERLIDDYTSSNRLYKLGTQIDPKAKSLRVSDPTDISLVFLYFLSHRNKKVHEYKKISSRSPDGKLYIHNK